MLTLTIQIVFKVIYFLLFAKLIINWIELSRSISRNPLVQILNAAVEPLLLPFQGLFQTRFDFSPILMFFLLSSIVEPMINKILF